MPPNPPPPKKARLQVVLKGRPREQHAVLHAELAQLLEQLGLLVLEFGVFLGGGWVEGCFETCLVRV